jgi:hypothetical protein
VIISPNTVSRNILSRDTAAAAAKTTKILDPLVLTDRKNPTFNRWLLKMKNKLKVNNNHFADEEAKIVYIQL